jgi:hypothetical protein
VSELNTGAVIPNEPLITVRTAIIQKAWEGYDASKQIRSVEDISAMVSTNRVFKVTFTDDDIDINMAR